MRSKHTSEDLGASTWTAYRVNTHSSTAVAMSNPTLQPYCHQNPSVPACEAARTASSPSKMHKYTDKALQNAPKLGFRVATLCSGLGGSHRLSTARTLPSYHPPVSGAAMPAGSLGADSLESVATGYQRRAPYLATTPLISVLATRKLHTRSTAPTQQRPHRALLPRQPRAADARGT